MTQKQAISKGCRRGVRHEVELPCELITSQCDEPLLFWATDLSRVGIWLETQEPLHRGDDVVLCFRPLMGWHGDEVQVFAQVQRIQRRVQGAPTLGMALEFGDLSDIESAALSRWLAPRPRKEIDISRWGTLLERRAVRSGLRSLAPLLH
ncbi:MAG: PilZ domain-containing protein [Polyangiaceae bacterium]|nr:PilZ domain-containing protein [Myxococcales bacterium]MCB9584336.1 PilZ domain-containing protein [Polyangiaceae bacterium]